MADAKRYKHRFLAENVYSDLKQLIALLDRLGIPTFEVTERVIHSNDVIYNLLLQSVAMRFTRRANEQQSEQ